MDKRILVFIMMTLSFVCSAKLSEFCHIDSKAGMISPKKIINPIPAREQWNNTNGYCGEVSLISAGLYYGQYVSQYDARRLANLFFTTKNKQLDQILIGYKGSSTKANNIIASLQQMHLNYEQFDNTTNPSQSTENFLIWVKKQVLEKYPVIIGVYENNSIFEEKSEPEYDHIIPVFGFESTHELFPVRYYSDDVIYFHDNGLYTEIDEDCYQYLLSNFQKSRSQANAQNGDVYSLSNNSNHLGNFGVAITGVRAQGADLLPVSITTDPINEYPEIKNKSDVRPRPNTLTLTIKVSELQKQRNYILYKYTDFSQLPAGDNFALSLGVPQSQCNIWSGTSNTFTTQERILSSAMAIYRVLEAPEGAMLPAPCLPL